MGPEFTMFVFRSNLQMGNLSLTLLLEVCWPSCHGYLLATIFCWELRSAGSELARIHSDEALSQVSRRTWLA